VQTTVAPLPGGTKERSGCSWPLSFFGIVVFFFAYVFSAFCALRSFRKVEFVAATFVRLGRKRLPY
jgi:hypothetical protein